LKALVVIPDLCRGCQICVLHCSFQHHKTHAPSRATIHVVRHGPDGHLVNKPVVCVQCGICLNACPVPGAMARNKAGAIVVKEEKCTGCGLCVMSCPYGMIKLDPITLKALKCDLCGGEPACVEHCPYGALAYLEPEQAAHLRRISVAGRQ
jgi:Fe-S-cluster-containing hydrogenase component 2